MVIFFAFSHKLAFSSVFILTTVFSGLWNKSQFCLSNFSLNFTYRSLDTVPVVWWALLFLKTFFLIVPHTEWTMLETPTETILVKIKTNVAKSCVWSFFFPSIIGKRLKHCPELGGKTHMEEECFWTHASPYSKCFPSHVIQSPEFSATQKTLSELMFFVNLPFTEAVIVLAQ